MNKMPDLKAQMNGIDYHEIIECIVGALVAKDPYTAGHSQRVSEMAMKVCMLFDFKMSEMDKMHIAAYLHDIGKIGVPDIVLNKTAQLNEQEWADMKKHPQIFNAGRIMSAV